MKVLVACEESQTVCKAFFMRFYNAKCSRIAIENPTPMKIIGLPEYTQAIQKISRQKRKRPKNKKQNVFRYCRSYGRTVGVFV